MAGFNPNANSFCGFHTVRTSLFNSNANSFCGFHTVRTSLGEVEFLVTESTSSYAWEVTSKSQVKLSLSSEAMTFNFSQAAYNDAVTEIRGHVDSLAYA